MFLLAILEAAPAQNLVKSKVFTCAHTTNQKKHCDYVIRAWSMSIDLEQKIYRVKDLPVSFTDLPNHFSLSTMAQLCAFVNKMGAAALRFLPSVKRI